MRAFDLREMDVQKEKHIVIPKKRMLDMEGLNKVCEILDEVRKNGESALKHYTALYDGCELEDLRVSVEEKRKAIQSVPSLVKRTLKEAAENIQRFHQHQMEKEWSIKPRDGVFLGQCIRPIERVGIYIPGGKASYPSTVLMNGIPAKIAGVKELVIFTPPQKNGSVSPLVLYAADLLGIEEIYKCGGAQGIAAAAYGTERIRAVDKIVGPGNRYVALAKKMVFGEVAIDMIAGPSEILIIADQTAEPSFIAADLLAQAEHDEEARIYLITDVPGLINQVTQEIERQIVDLKRRAIVEQVLMDGFYSYLVRDIKDGVILSNDIAPEHLELMVKEPEKLLDAIENAGAVFLGKYSPEVLGDYFAGTNHTLPTNRTARFSSPLGVYDFIKRPSYLSYSKEAFYAVGEKIGLFAEQEGLDGHKNAAIIRMRGGS